ncbi:hypothetical protein DQG13_18820 [Paenibacillus sp. YN15]|nr:hypothetical protein DQG13_18820 [Paenibacillus sp. YN15]
MGLFRKAFSIRRGGNPAHWTLYCRIFAVFGSVHVTLYNIIASVHVANAAGQAEEQQIGEGDFPLFQAEASKSRNNGRVFSAIASFCHP